jgi:diphosphomevalonate decarboxylase
MTSMETGELLKFCEIVENEALTLHALMFSSSPAVVLFQPGTIDIIKKVRKFRDQTGIPVCFTIDAGPNVHLLYPDSVKVDIRQLIERELVVSCEHNLVISDHLGKGPVKLSA